MAALLSGLPSRVQPSRTAAAAAPRDQLSWQPSAVSRRASTAAGGGRTTQTPVSSRLDAIVVQHLRQQHRAACLRSAAPTMTLPPMSLLKRHELPQVRTAAACAKMMFHKETVAVMIVGSTTKGCLGHAHTPLCCRRRFSALQIQ